MVRPSGGLRNAMRFKLRKDPRHKFTVERFLQTFTTGQKVAVDLHPGSYGGMPHGRMQGLVGKVMGKRGDAYILHIPVGNKTKTVIAKPEHLHAIKETT